jgi:ADP-ribose pyrophosphatase YjhB (NUDIX family)
MQVYCVVHDGNNILVAKKNVTNSQWNGQQTREAPVNQAGQYALPGGRVEGNNSLQSLVDNAVREFQEETGVGIGGRRGNERQYPSYVSGPPRLLYQTQQYAVVGVKIEPAVMLQVFQAAASVCIRRAREGAVRDGELASVFMVPRESAYQFLGVYVEPEGTQSQMNMVERARQRNRYSQGPDSITWYREIAEWLYRNAL